MQRESIKDPAGEIKVSFGYQWDSKNGNAWDIPNGIDIPSPGMLRRANSSFPCFSGAALSANATLANTNMCNGIIRAEILPTLDSPNSFHRIPSSPSLGKMEFLSSSLQSSMSNMSISTSSPSETLDNDSFSSSFLNAEEVQVAGDVGTSCSRTQDAAEA